MKSKKMQFSENHLIDFLMGCFKSHFVGMTELTTKTQSFEIQYFMLKYSK